MSTRTRAGVAGLIIAAALAAPSASPGEAASSARLQQQIDHIIENSAPGARQVARNRVQWPRDGVTLTFQPPGIARAARFTDCPERYACLWQDAGGQGRRIEFLRYGTYKLRAYGMPPFTHRGASSYYNHQIGGAKAILHADFDFDMHGRGSLYGALNDRGRSITLRR